MDNIGLEFALEMKNRFNGLQLAEREPEELWNDIRSIVKETADTMVPKAKRKKVTKWLSDAGPNHRLQEGLRLCRPLNTVGDTEG